MAQIFARAGPRLRSDSPRRVKALRPRGRFDRSFRCLPDLMYWLRQTQYDCKHNMKVLRPNDNIAGDVLLSAVDTNVQRVGNGTILPRVHGGQATAGFRQHRAYNRIAYSIPATGEMATNTTTACSYRESLRQLRFCLARFKKAGRAEGPTQNARAARVKDLHPPMENRRGNYKAQEDREGVRPKPDCVGGVCE